jgi:hypothetical protein
LHGELQYQVPLTRVRVPLGVGRTSNGQKKSTGLAFGRVTRTDISACNQIHSSERSFVLPARSYFSSRYCLHVSDMNLTARHAPDLKL